MPGIISVVQEKLNLSNAVARADKNSVSLYLVLLDYKPIIKYVNGYRCFLYVNAYSRAGDVYFLARRQIRKQKNGQIDEESAGILDDYLIQQATQEGFLNEMIVFSGATVPADLKYTDAGVSGREISSIDYIRQNLELQALLFMTKDFQLFEQSVFQGRDRNRFMQFELMDTLSANGARVSRIEWIRVMYNTYMLYRNIELTDYYYYHQVKPRLTYLEANRAFVFDEYIPLLFKFRAIPNPLLNTLPNLATDRESLFIFESTYNHKLFNNAEIVAPINPISSYLGQQGTNSEVPYGVYTTRAEMTQVFDLNCGKYRMQDVAFLLGVRMKTHTFDFYSPKYFLTLYLSELARTIDASEIPTTERLGANIQAASQVFCIPNFDRMVHFWYTPDNWTTEDGAYEAFDSVELVCILPDCNRHEVLQSRVGANTSLAIRDMSWGNALYLEYCTKLFRTIMADTAWNQVAVLPNMSQDEMQLEEGAWRG